MAADGIGYFAEASFPARLHYLSDIGFNNRDFYINISYGCRLLIKENTLSKFVAIYLPNVTYYNFFHENETLTFRTDLRSEKFTFKKATNNDSFLLLLKDDEQVNNFLKLLNEKNSLILNTQNDTIISKINFIKVKNEKEIFDIFCQKK